MFERKDVQYDFEMRKMKKLLLLRGGLPEVSRAECSFLRHLHSLLFPRPKGNVVQVYETTGRNI